MKPFKTETNGYFHYQLIWQSFSSLMDFIEKAISYKNALACTMFEVDAQVQLHVKGLINHI